MGFLYFVLTVIFTIIEFIIWICKVWDWSDNYGDWDYGKPPFKSLFRTYDLIQFIFIFGLPIILIEIAFILFISCIVHPERHGSFLNKPLFKSEEETDEEE